MMPPVVEDVAGLIPPRRSRRRPLAQCFSASSEQAATVSVACTGSTLPGRPVPCKARVPASGSPGGLVPTTCTQHLPQPQPQRGAAARPPRAPLPLMQLTPAEQQSMLMNAAAAAWLSG